MLSSRVGNSFDSIFVCFDASVRIEHIALLQGHKLLYFHITGWVLLDKLILHQGSPQKSLAETKVSNIFEERHVDRNICIL